MLSKETTEWCPFCKGTGRIPGATERGLVCDQCDGTGDYFRACVRRAYNRGVQDGMRGIRDAHPSLPPKPEWKDLIRPVTGP